MPFTAQQITGLIACDIVQPVRCCVPFPGGGELCATTYSFDPMALLAPYIQALNSAMIPLMPIFRIIDTVVAIVECIKALPQAVVTLNPAPIFQCLEKLIRVIVEILKLIPFISLPFTLLGIFDCIILFLRAIRDTVLRILVRFAQITILLGSTDPNQVFIAQCELQLLQAQLGNLNALMAAMASIFRLVNLFLGFFNLSVPTQISLSAGTDPQIVVAPLDVAITTLTRVRSFIPITSQAQAS
jgi:hypothetical protein